MFDNLDEKLKRQAELLGVSEAKLKCVYARGIKECSTEAYIGSPAIYGLARVQRFVTAYQTGNTRLTMDEDLMPCRDFSAETDESSYIVTDENNQSLSLLADIMHGDGSSIDEMFAPGQVIQYTYDTGASTLHVAGLLDGSEWIYSLCLNDGQYKFSMPG